VEKVLWEKGVHYHLAHDLDSPFRVKCRVLLLLLLLLLLLQGPIVNIADC
jgi:hypothetical protein